MSNNNGSGSIELIKNLRAEMHDLINIISRFDSFNRKLKKGAEIEDDQKLTFDKSVTDAKLSVSKVRDIIIQLEDKIEKEAK